MEYTEKLERLLGEKEVERIRQLILYPQPNVKSNTEQTIIKKDATLNNVRSEKSKNIKREGVKNDKKRSKKSLKKRRTVEKTEDISEYETKSLNLHELQFNKGCSKELREITYKTDLANNDPRKVEELLRARTEEAKSILITFNTTKNVHKVKKIGEGKGFNKFKAKLEDLSAMYKVPFAEVCKMLEQASGNFATLEKALKGDKGGLWTKLEDLTLKQIDNEEMRSHLISIRGESEVKKRLLYLGLKSS